MKNIYLEPEFAAFNELSDSEMRRLGFTRVTFIQEVNGRGTPTLEPRLKITGNDGNTEIIDGSNKILEKMKFILKLSDQYRNQDFQKIICDILVKQVPAKSAVYAGNSNYVVTDSTGTKTSIKVDKDQSINYVSAGFPEKFFVTQLVNAVRLALENVKGPNRRRFYFNGIFWTTDQKPSGSDKSAFKILGTEEVEVMLANSKSGHYGEHGFEDRPDIRTWTSDKSFEEMVSFYKRVKPTIQEQPLSPGKPVMLEFKDVSDELYRIYEWPDGKIVKVKDPVSLNVSKSGGHRVLDKAGMSHYIPSGWVHLYWKVKPGKEPFAF